MSGTTRWFAQGLEAMDRVVRLVDDEAWDRPSPCEGWSARHVLGHVIAMQHYYAACVEGRPPPMDPMTDPDRHASDRPRRAWRTARDLVLEAVGRPGALDEVVGSVTGPVRVEELIRLNVVDSTVHSWDLARAAGVDDRLDPALVAHCLALLPDAPWSSPPRGDDQDALLVATGRSPR